MTWWMSLTAVVLFTRALIKERKRALAAVQKAQGPNYLVPRAGWMDDPTLRDAEEKVQLYFLGLLISCTWALLACSFRGLIFVFS